MTAIGIDLPNGRHYDVVVGHDILQSLGERCRNLGLGDRCALITDAALTDNLATVAAVSLRDAGFEVLTVPYAAGEGGKNLASVETLVGAMLEAGFDRGAWVVALGGGVDRGRAWPLNVAVVDQIGSAGVVFHGGSHGGAGFDAIFDQAVAAVRAVLAARFSGLICLAW